jgi:TetR/AcrR family transcriptional regulator, transcriptional repressor for nem operon
VPRPREFDEQDAVARATELFHRRGYHATSTRDLGEALALNPSSLYRAFGDKHALFLRALDHYQQCEYTRSAAAMEGDRPVRAVLRDWLCALADPTDPPGCFVVNTATELGTDDPDAARRVQAGFDAMTAAIADLLRRGVADGELPAALDPDAAADLLFTTATGLRVRHRAGHDARRLQAVVDQALRALG